MFSKNRFDEHLKSCSSRSRDDTFALQVGNTLDTAVCTSDEKSHVGSHGRDSANVILFIPGAFTTGSEERNRSIGKCQFKFVLLQTPDILLRSFGAFGLDFPVNRLLVFIQYFRDRTTHDWKSTTNGGSPHAEELLRRILLAATHHNSGNNQEAGKKSVNSSHRSGTLKMVSVQRKILGIQVSHKSQVSPMSVPSPRVNHERTRPGWKSGNWLGRSHFAKNDATTCQRSPTQSHIY